MNIDQLNTLHMAISARFCGQHPNLYRRVSDALEQRDEGAMEGLALEVRERLERERSIRKLRSGNDLIPRPKGKRPVQLRSKNANAQPWIEWENSVYEYVNGDHQGAETSWSNHKNELLGDADVKSRKEFLALHRRVRERDRKQRNKAKT